MVHVDVMAEIKPKVAIIIGVGKSMLLQPQPMKKEAAEERSSQRKEVSEGRKGPSDTYNFAYILYQGLCLNM